MITCLEGTIELTAEKFVILNVGGIGYKVFAGPGVLQKIPQNSGVVKIWTHQHVREDSLELYGFLQYGELEFFEHLISISGIGPKGAIGILSVAPLDTLKRAISAGDSSYLTKVSGIGRKTAEKIILELREKMSGIGATVEAPELKHEADALEALVSLGYSRIEARGALASVPASVAGVEERIKEVLKKIGK